MVLKFLRVQRLYASLPAGYMAKSAVSLLVVGGCTFFACQVLRGDERFHREWAMPLVHRIFAAESAHVIGIKLARRGWLVTAENQKEYPELACKLFGKDLNNPIGMAAGFDKNGDAIDGLRRSGFGFVEIGSVTPRHQFGNARPRVFRLPEDEAVINSYGFNSHGIGPVLSRVQKAFDPNCSVPLGINLGKNKDTVDAVHDYELGVNNFSPYCDYLVVNISSPNTPGLRALQAKNELKKVLVTLRETLRRSSKSAGKVPHLLVKISPDLTKEQLADIAEVCIDQCVSVDGLIVTNTSMRRPDSLISSNSHRLGGLSGRPIRDLSTKCIAEIYRSTQGKIPIIGCGGVASGADAYEKIRAGASAVQLYTALVYQGFPVIGRVKRELAELLRRDGYAHVAEAVGAQHRNETNSRNAVDE
uniref:Dihydroorotate dehydrogenase (quinone), mitochondrial n=1 Tax=Globodera rostochiensis TaxID=31243 RepID=A0A914HE05_GLORO